MSLQPFPEDFDRFRLPDECFTAAYEAVKDTRRAGLKDCIAMLYSWFGKGALNSRQTHDSPEGYSFQAQACPAAFSMVFCQAAYPCAEHLLAMVMPAVFAGVAQVGVVFVGEGADAPVAGELLLATELGGLEDVFILEDLALADSLIKSLGDGASGRILGLGKIPGLKNIFGQGLLDGHGCFYASAGATPDCAVGQCDGQFENAGILPARGPWALFGNLDLAWYTNRKVLAKAF